jgi:hypothetical protein
MSDIEIIIMLGIIGVALVLEAGYLLGHRSGRLRERCSTLDTTKLHMLAKHGSYALSPPVTNMNHRPQSSTLEEAMKKHIRERK